MVTSHDMFGQARLKLVWANEHIKQLNAAWNAFLKTDFCHLAVENQPPRPGIDDGGQVIVLKSVDPIPAELPLLIGDAVHNLKAALDYTVSELLGWKDTKRTFPMAKTREELESSFRTDPEVIDGKTMGKGRNASIEEALPGIGAFILQEIRPYKAANGFLWPLNKLDVRDKHRLLVPLLIPQTVSGICASDIFNNEVTGCAISVLPGQINRAFGLGPGIVIKSYAKATAEILFNEVGIIERQPVLPTLVQMSQAVAETIDSMAEFASSVGWTRPEA